MMDKIAMAELEDEQDGSPYSEKISDFRGLHPILTPASDRRERIRKQVVKSLQKSIPVQAKHYKLDVEDIAVQPQNYSLKDQKDAILGGKSLTEAVKGTLILRDNAGKIVDKSKRTLARIPWMTDRHTFTVGGNDYVIGNQVRIKPGVYTRTRTNGELEAAFNLGRGKNFRVYMDPVKGIFFLQYDSTKILLYPVLRALGITDGVITQKWGAELMRVNKVKSQKTQIQIRKLYNKIIHPKLRKARASDSEMATAIMAAYDNTVLNPSVTEKTLGKRHSKVGALTLLDASKKILRVYNEETPEDDRDSLEFKTLHTVDTFFKERIEKDASRRLQFKIKNKLNRSHRPTIKDVVPSSPFSPALRALVTTSALSNNPSQINPIEILDGALKVTSLGEGGISSLRAVPDTARDQHGSQLGIIDPVRTPESGAVGVDVRAATYAAVDAKGNMYTPLIDARTKKAKYVPVTEFMRKNVAFPGSDMSKRRVPVLHNNGIRDMTSGKVDYIVPSSTSMYTPSTTLVPMLNSAQGNRNILGSKMQTQAVPLVHREVPWIQTDRGDGKGSMEKELAKWHLPIAESAGVVWKIDEPKNQIVINLDKGGKQVVDYAENFPFASKTRLHHFLKVKKGDRVRKGQVLADSNFTKGGTLALGTNLNTAYMAYNGLNSNDAVVISSAASKKLSSEHTYQEKLRLTENMKASKALHRNYFGTKYGAGEYDILDTDGVARRGTTVQPGALLMAAIDKKKMTADDAMLGRLNKTLVKPYRDAAITWDHSYPGEIVDVVKTPKQIIVQVHTVEPMGVGDKLSGRYGNKGVVSKIIDTGMMPHVKGRPIDIMLTSAGVISRINPNQIIETAVSKVAEKTGKPIIVEQFPKHNRVKWAKGLLKKHGLKDKETVTDPTTGKEIPNIMVGNQYFLKLFKSTDTNFSTRAVGSKDVNMQPTRGGKEGAKSFGRMDFYALLAHNARNTLKEGATFKSDKNDEFWRRVQLGLPESQPKPSFAFNKFQNMLVGGGINMKKRGDQFMLAPITDRDVDALATHTIRNPGVVKVKASKNAINVVPEKGGLFDPALTGGLRGTLWSKIELAEPVVNPVFEKPARELLGLSGTQFTKTMFQDGGQAIRDRLNGLNLTAKEKELQEKIDKKIDSSSPTAVTQVNGWVRQLKYIKSLKKEGFKAGDAYTLSKVPVLPPVMRSLVSGGDNKVLVSDPNFLYKDLMLVNQSIQNTPAELREIDGPEEGRGELFGAVKALFGLGDPINEKTKARGARGFITQIAGQNSPKQGYFHQKLMTRRQDLSGRGTIAPDPSLALDEVGLPEEMLWTQYEPFIIRRLVRKGYTALDARKAVQDRTVLARQELLAETEQRPVLINRAPTLHRFNMIAATPRPVPGKTIRLNPFAEIGMNADYDGDAMQVHVPATQAARLEAQDMTLSKLVFSDASRNSLMVRPQHEAIIGAYKATHRVENKATKKYATKADAMAAYHRGDISMSSPVEIAELER